MESEAIEIKKGEWYAICCIYDLRQAKEDMEFDYLAYGPFNSELKALQSLRKDASFDEFLIIDNRIKNIKTKNY